MIICGVDEAGRGPIAGPVTAAAVILPPGFPTDRLEDSKQLSEPQRLTVADLIRRTATCWTLGWVWPEEIDRINIHRGSLLAMARAINRLPIRPDLILVDGRFPVRVGVPCRSEIRGDARIPEIKAASIMAKTERDRLMARLGRVYPGYRFCKHKGYPTPDHRRLVAEFGLSAIHRRSFSWKLKPASERS